MYRRLSRLHESENLMQCCSRLRFKQNALMAIKKAGPKSRPERRVMLLPELDLGGNQSALGVSRWRTRSGGCPVRSGRCIDLDQLIRH